MLIELVKPLDSASLLPSCNRISKHCFMQTFFILHFQLLKLSLLCLVLAQNNLLKSVFLNFVKLFHLIELLAREAEVLDSRYEKG